MLTQRTPAHASALEDFHWARQRAMLKDILARLTGHSADLLPYDEVRQKLRAKSSADRGLREIPLNAIVGSVNRYSDFTRDFLPRGNVMPDRWAEVKNFVRKQDKIPPIEVYKIGDVYFVKDGNHRVSVSRQMGIDFISAYVTEVSAHVSLTPDVTPDELIVKAEYSGFLESTCLDKTHPEADLCVSAPGQYEKIEEHIDVHKYYMEDQLRHPVSCEEAASDWYVQVYLPAIETIRQCGILKDFPGRTETDLYLWLMDYRASLEEQVGQPVASIQAANELAVRLSSQPWRVAARLGQKLLGRLKPAHLDGGPAAGRWREERSAAPEACCLFSDILVPVNGQPESWSALEAALIIARCEGSSPLHGLHVVEHDDHKDSPAVLAIQEEFKRRCEQAGHPGKLSVIAGDLAEVICDVARWNDLVVATMTHPPAGEWSESLNNGFRGALQRCPRPVLVVPQSTTRLKKPLVAYDGSPKAREALFVGAYLAKSWKVPLAVVTVFDNTGRVPPETLLESLVYLEEHDLEAKPIKESGSEEEAIMRTVAQGEYDLLLIGGYGRNPLIGAMIGSGVDCVLRQTSIPVLVCR